MSLTGGRDSSEHSSVLFDALSDPYRLRVIYILKEAKTSLTLVDLSREILRQEYEETAQGVDADETELLRLSLYHRHVPKLTAAGLLEFDSREMRAALAESAPLDAVDMIAQ